MRLVIGTAGHVDHGKTALVKALTGVDTDRLPEEKRRGITIDLGYASLDVAAPDNTPLRISFVDVPGHALFIRNMLAGAGCVPAVMLIIAADEGVKPQTREHLAICQLLGISDGFQHGCRAANRFGPSQGRLGRSRTGRTQSERPAESRRPAHSIGPSA